MFKRLFALLFCLPSISFADGGFVGNGGGFSLCENRRYYAYDYLIADPREFGEDRQVTSWKDSLETIFGEIDRLGDPETRDFREFIDSIFSQKTGNRYQWFPDRDLELMWEPGLEPLLPPQCRERKQAVHQFAANQHVNYTAYVYDTELLPRVASQPEGELQISYLLVHEWLWNRFSRTTIPEMARLNRLLHSENLRKLSPDQYRRIVKSLVSKEDFRAIGKKRKSRSRRHK